MLTRSLWFKFYIVLILLLLAVELNISLLRAPGVDSVPLPLFALISGAIIPAVYFKEFLSFIKTKKLLFILISGAFILGLISAFFSPLPLWGGIKIIMAWGVCFGISILLLFLFALEQKLNVFFLKGLLAIAIFLAGLSLVEVANSDVSTWLAKTFRSGEIQLVSAGVRAGATLAHPNIFGCFMSLAVLILFSLTEPMEKKKPFWGIIIVLCMGISFSASLNAYLVLCVPLGILCCQGKTFKIAFGTLIIAVCFAYIAKSPATRLSAIFPARSASMQKKSQTSSVAKEKLRYSGIKCRMLLWESAINIYRQYPFTGVGPGGFNLVLKDYAPKALLRIEEYKIKKNYLNAHNLLFNILAEFGTLGIIYFFVCGACALNLFYRKYKFFPFLPVHALFAGILIPFILDNFSYNMFYLTIVLTLLFIILFQGECFLAGSKEHKVNCQET
ncbi:MAG: O-antigen ligase family protein [Victivallaceae bacterium]|nr:O-antigen ligase family protein [Victivallaceae bacterium]